MFRNDVGKILRLEYNNKKIQQIINKINITR
jgi:hypothetical protein